MNEWYIKNGDYPFQDGVGIAEPFRLGKPAPIEAWNIVDGDYPYKTTVEKAKPFRLTIPPPELAWKVVVDYDGQVQSDDYPVIFWKKPIVLKPARQYEYITIHASDTPQNGFDNNGLRILTPTACESNEAENGAYELSLKHPIDDEGVWEQIREGRIIKAGGQLYTIYRVQHSYSGRSGAVVAYARHISYDLLDGCIYHLEVDADDGQSVIDAVLENKVGGYYDFNGFSDIEKAYTETFDAVTPLSALMQYADSVGGYLHRDNFDFSINHRMEGTADKAFQLRVGLNILGITREIDLSDYCTNLRVEDGYGKHVDLSVEPVHGRRIYRAIQMRYDEEPSTAVLQADAQMYFGKINKPYIRYTVKIKDLKNNPDYAMFENLPKYKVGDSGSIYDERLGISTEQKVISRRRNEITGEVIEVVFANTARTITSPSENRLATRDDQFLLKQISGSASSVEQKVTAETDEKISDTIAQSTGRLIAETSCDAILIPGQYYTADDAQASALGNTPFSKSFTMAVKMLSSVGILQQAESIEGVKKRLFDGSAWTQWEETT